MQDQSDGRPDQMTYEVTPDNGGWLVKIDGAEMQYNDRADAIAMALRQAELRGDAIIRVRNRDGEVELERVVGRDAD
jgi:Uncharacterized protein conserved in bacteria (DUF2188)